MQPVQEAEGELGHREIMTILSGLLVAMFVASLDATIVTTAIRTIGDDLHGLSMQAWVTTGFLITSTIATPLFGKLSDIYGRKRLLKLAICIFLAGSVLCGLATSMYMLAAFRAIQGVGAGGILPLSQAVIGDIMSPRVRARYQGYFVSVYGTASVIGPVIGGFFAGASSILGIAGWRWIFYINVPIGILALIILEAKLPSRYRRSERRIDWGGAAALVVGLVPLLLVAEQGRLWGWNSPAAFTCYALGIFGLAAFVFIESRMGDDALLPLKIFRGNTFSLACVQSVLLGVVMFGGMAVLPLYLQIVRGASPTASGLLTLPLVAGMMTGSWGSGQIMARTGRYRYNPIAGTILLTIGMGLLALTTGGNTPLWQTDIFMAIYGLGMGLVMHSMVMAMQNAVHAKDMGVATAASNFFRSVGGSLATAAFLTILFSRFSEEIPKQLAKARAVLPSGRGVDLNDSRTIGHLPDVARHAVLDAFGNSVATVFMVATAICVLSVITSFLMKEIPLRTVSGHIERRQAAAAEDSAAGVTA
jgi:EmrB/QacA subfamily drug resistance transporter